MSCSRESTFLTATSMRPKQSRIGVAGLRALEPAAVGEAAPGLVDLGDVGVAAPVARVDELQQTGAVGARLRAEDAHRRLAPGARAELGREPLGIVAGVRGDVVLVGRLVERRHLRDGVVEQHDEVREGVAEEARDAHRDVDARPAELLQRDHLDARSRAATRGATSGARRSARGSRRRRRPACASPTSPTPRARPCAAARPSRRGSGRAARRRAGTRPPTRSATAARAGRRSRSCARSGARRRGRAWGCPTAPTARAGR